MSCCAAVSVSCTSVSGQAVWCRVTYTSDCVTKARRRGGLCRSVGAFGDLAHAVGVSRARGDLGPRGHRTPAARRVMAWRSRRDAHPTDQSPCDFYFPSSGANGPSPYTTLPPTIVSTECKSATFSTGTVR